MTIENGKICDNCVHYEPTTGMIGFCTKQRIETRFGTWCKDFEKKGEKQ